MKYKRKINFSQKNQNLLLVCSIKIVNLWKTVLIIPVYRYAKFPILPTGGNTPPLNAISKTLPVLTYEQNFVEHS